MHVEHVVEEVAPDKDEYVPAEQRVQELEPGVLEYEPIQGEQVVDPGREKDPDGQMVQSTEPPDEVHEPSMEERDKVTIGPE